MELWELAARERIRDTLARYTWSGDAGKVADQWLISHRFVSTDRAAPNSTMVG